MAERAAMAALRVLRVVSISDLLPVFVFFPNSQGHCPSSYDTHNRKHCPWSIITCCRQEVTLPLVRSFLVYRYHLGFLSPIRTGGNSHLGGGLILPGDRLRVRYNRAKRERPGDQHRGSYV